VEYLLVVLVVELGELVRGPGNGIGFAGTGAVLHQILVAWTFLAAGRDQARDQIPLVIARKDQGLFFGLAAVPVLLGLDLQMDEAADDLQEVSRRQNFVPQIVGA